MPLHLEKLDILLIDDNQHIRSLLKDVLRGFKIRKITDAYNGEDAWRKFTAKSFDIALVDWMMEPINGLEFLDLVRNSSETPNAFLPVIMVTGHTERKRIFQARDLGVTEFLAKPITPKSLYQRLRSVIERPRNFIRTNSYFGPDRRRRTHNIPFDNRRIDMNIEAEENPIVGN